MSEPTKPHPPATRVAEDSTLASSIVETSRLRLRPCTLQDARELRAVFVLPDVRRYLFDDDCVDEEWVRGVIEDSRKLFETRGFGLWIASPRESDPEEPKNLIGFAGFREFFAPPQLQLLYGLHPAAWGRGYATDMARRLIDLAFSRFDLDEVIAATDLPNKASIRVMERAGLAPWKTTDQGLWGTVYYRLRRADHSASGRLPSPELRKSRFAQ